MSLPTGTITFLFTDIEGSTRLWEAQPDTMRLALARHDALLRAAIETNGGVVFKTIGDAFCAAFSTAPQALEAALSAQQSLLRVKAGVGSGLMLKVRMALHTGSAEHRDNDYFGQPLNRVARLLAVGFGGQVLLSFPAEELVRDSLPAQASLLSLGDHRLKDLARAERVFQLLHPELPSDFPPLRSLDNPSLPNNLPRQVTSFIGREKELHEIKARIRSSPLLTLTGSGGCGKTRLSLQVAADVLDYYSDGVWFVELAPVADPALIPQTVADVLGIRETPREPITRTLAGALKAKQLLLVLDNCEHVLEAAARLVDALMKSCPGVGLLVSSREALGIAGESAYRVPSLSLPLPGMTYTPQSLSQYEAVHLFIERAVAVKADFVVTSQNAPALAQACHRLDGIPLAIELAAARIRSMTVEELGHKLDDRFRILTGGSRTALPRQQTLRAMIDWSYDLLEGCQRSLFIRLCVFLGGWTLAAAEAVCSGSDVEEWEVLDLLTALCDKSLVTTEERGEKTRYRLLETVRQYAREKLTSEEDATVYQRQHCDYFLALAEEIRPKLIGPEQARWLEALETEHDNLRQALTFCLEKAEGIEKGLRLGAALPGFWRIRGYLSEGRERLNALLSHHKAQAYPRARADALNGAGLLAWYQGDYAAARSLFLESLALKREAGNRQGIADSLNNLGLVAWNQGDYVSAHSLHLESLALKRELGDKQGIADSLNNLGLVARNQGDNAAARSLYQESLAIKRELGNRRGIAESLNNQGSIASSQGDYVAARSLFEESLSIQRELEDRYGIAYSLNNLGLVARNQSDYASAHSLSEQSLEIMRELGNREGIAEALNNLGLVVADQGDYASARSLHEESLLIRRELGNRRGIADSLGNQGIIAGRQGDYVAARPLLEESLSIQRELEDKWGASECLNSLGSIACAQGDYAAARVLLAEGLSIQWELGDQRGIAYSLETFASLCAQEDKPEQTALLYGAAERLREKIGSLLSPNDQDRYDRGVTAAREALGEAAFAAAWANGRFLGMEQAIEYALEKRA